MYHSISKHFFSCHRDSIKIRGTVFVPDRNQGEQLPIAIICHEFMANQLFSYPYAKALARCGYAAFCFDFCGGGLICSSQGSSRDMSVVTEIADLKAVIQHAKAQDYTDESTLLLMGCSQGGLVAALTATEMNRSVSGLILQYPALCIPDAARKGEMLWLKFDPTNIPEKMHSGPMRLGRRYAADVLNIDVFQTIPRYTGKVLILHGTQDTIADIADSRKAFKVYRETGADARFKTISGGKHIFRKPAHIKQAKSIISQLAIEIKEK